MAITTYTSLVNIRQTEDPQICAELDALTTAPVVEEYSVEKPRAHWWQRRHTQTLYGVLWPLGDTMLGTEWQIVNFYLPPPATSINTLVPKEVILAYLYGCSAVEQQARDSREEGT